MLRECSVKGRKFRVGTDQALRPRLGFAAVERRLCVGKGFLLGQRIVRSGCLCSRCGRPEQDASLLLLTEVDERGNTTKGWVRIVTVDGVDVSKVPNTWAHIEPGQHDIKFVCRAGPLHAAFKERVKQATYVLEPNTTYFWKINLIYSVDGRPMNCEGDGMNEPGMDKGHIALIPGL